MKKNIGMLISVKDGKTEEIFYALDKKEDEYLVMQSIYQEADKKIKDNNIVIVSTKSSTLRNEEKSGFDQFELTIPNEIVEEDYPIFQQMLKSLHFDDDQNNISIINYCIRNGYQDYDYHDCDFIKYGMDDKKPSTIVDLFFRRKLDKLTDDEKKMYEKYEKFNLQQILYEDNLKYTLNNGNSGVITIFPNKTYATPTTKIEHSYEHKQHLNAYKKETGRYCPDNIYIQLETKRAVCWIPTETNEYQKQTLGQIIDQISEFDEVIGKVDVYGITINGDSASTNYEVVKELENMTQVKEYINSSKSSHK